jgi:TatA/E family protein of Tat protein translocase
MMQKERARALVLRLPMLSIPHLIVIFVVALVIFGPEKLPDLARNLGKVMAEFRRHTSDLRTTFEGHLRDIEREGESRRIAAVPAAVARPPAAEAQTPASPGTVPSKPPNAAAIAGPSGDLFPADVPDPDLRRKDPGDDPYLSGTEFNPGGPPEEPQAPEPEKNSDRVENGGVRPS